MRRLNHQKETFLSECDLCGQCIEVCQVLPYLEFSHKNPVEIQKERLDVLRGNRASHDVYIKAFACTNCASCLHSCPKGLNPFLMQRIIKAELVASGQKPQPENADTRFDGTVKLLGSDHIEYDWQDILCSLQLKPSEVRWLREIPANPKQTDIVLFSGCHIRLMPEKIQAIQDILVKLDLDFVTLVGGQLCCGGKHLVAGDLEKADSSCRELLLALEAFRPKKVVFWCGVCYSRFKDDVPAFASLNFEVQHFTQLLCDNLAKFNLSNPINKTVTIHDSCALGRMGDDYTSMRKLLGAIPGVKLVEMPHNKADAICCGGTAYAHYPEIGKQLRRRRLEEAKSTGADILTPSCGSCGLYFSLVENRYPFEVKNCATLFAEALGLNYENKLGKWLKLQDVDRILEEAKEYLQESPFTFEQARSVVSSFLNKLRAAR
ncbi:(Fe-S)-binding protein [Chloroflexota bacterium]